MENEVADEINPQKTEDISNRPIGVFDSGLGGLTVLAAIRSLLPQEDLIYFGDTARVPYGNKSKQTVIRYSLEIIEFLLSKGVKAIVVACNTASSYALPMLEKALQEAGLSIPIIGMVEPGVLALQKFMPSLQPPFQKVALIATRSTVRSSAYEKKTAQMFPQIQLFSRACPLFVPLIEEGMLDKVFTEMIVREYLDEIDREKISYVILGCTHYPLLKKTIQRMYPHFKLIDSSLQAAEFLQKQLRLQKLLKENLPQKDLPAGGVDDSQGSIRLYVSDISDSLQDLALLFFGNSIDSVQQMDLSW